MSDVTRILTAIENGDSSAAELDDRERTRLRKQALDWLRADLALRSRQLNSGNPGDQADVRSNVLYWQEDRDLAPIRDSEGLAKLPADEQQAFMQLWTDVAALLVKANEQENPAP